MSNFFVFSKPMQTTLNIDETIIAEVRTYYGSTSLDVIVQEALQTLLTLRKQDAVRSLRGKLLWEGDIHIMRMNEHEVV
jgi:hypothetical protein